MSANLVPLGLAIAIGLVISNGCSSSESNCSGIDPSADLELPVDGAIADIVSFEALELNASGDGARTRVLSEGEGVGGSRLRLLLKMFLTDASPVAEGPAFDVLALLVPSAHACSPPPGNAVSAVSSVTSVDVFSTSALGGTAPGQSLAGAFSASLGFYGQAQTVAETFAQPRNAPVTISMDLLEAPGLTALHTFTVRYELSTGEVFEASTVPVLVIGEE